MLWIVLAVALAVRIVTALALPNLCWPDEVYQTLEPAHRLAFGTGVVTHEWRTGMRSWLLPGVLAFVMKLTASTGPGSLGYLAGVAIVLSLLSVGAVAAGFSWAYRQGGRAAAVITGSLLALWPDMVYFAPKALTEVVAVHVLLPAAYVGAHGKVGTPRLRLLVAAFGCAIVTSLRPQLGPAVVVVLVWLLARAGRSGWLPLGSGVVAGFAVTGGLDWLTWGAPFHALWANVHYNLVEGQAETYGWLPRYYYAVYLWHTWLPPTALLMAALMLIGVRRVPLAAAIAVAIVVPHSLVGHKEYRFLYPAIPFLLLLAGVGAARVAEAVERARSLSLIASTRVMVALIAGASLWAALDYSAAKTPTGLRGPRLPVSLWRQSAGPLRALRLLSCRSDVTGVGLVGLDWEWCGGFTNLHHDVPLAVVRVEGDLADPADGYSHVVAKAGSFAGVPGFTRLARIEDVEVYGRDGTSSIVPSRGLVDLRWADPSAGERPIAPELK